MKTFPRFNDAIILQSITQPQAKVILVALNAFARSLDNQTSASDLKSLMAHCQASYDFSFPASYSENPKLLQPQVHQLIDTICNAYCEERDYQVNLATDHFTQFAQDNFDPDVFNLAPGQSLRLTNHD